MDIANRIIEERGLAYAASRSEQAHLDGEGLDHWDCRFEGEGGTLEVGFSGDRGVRPTAAAVLSLLGADLADLRSLAGPEDIARAWGLDAEAAAATGLRLARMEAEAQAVLGPDGLSALVTGIWPGLADGVDLTVGM